MPLQADLSGFAAHLALHDRRKTTVKRHLNSLRFLTQHLHALTKEDVDTFLIEYKQQGKSNSYLNTFINTIRLYSQYKQLDQALQSYKQFKKIYGIKATFSDDEIEAFLALPRRKNQSPLHHKRMTMFWKCIAYTGARPGEIARLKKQHVDWGRGVFVIETSKTNQPGVAPIAPNIKQDLREYMDTIEGDYLFPAARGGNSYTDGEFPVIDNVDWHHDWKKRINILKITRPRLTPYSFRHSMATRLLEENVSLFHVKKLLRHNDLKSTLVYSHLTTKDIQEAITKHPIIRRGTEPKTVLKHIIEILQNLHLENDSRFRYKLQQDEGSIKFEAIIAKYPQDRPFKETTY